MFLLQRIVSPQIREFLSCSNFFSCYNMYKKFQQLLLSFLTREYGNFFKLFQVDDKITLFWIAWSEKCRILFVLLTRYRFFTYYKNFLNNLILARLLNFPTSEFEIFHNLLQGIEENMMFHISGLKKCLILYVSLAETFEITFVSTI